MVDIKSSGQITHKIGQLRQEYLNLANMSYANANSLTDYRISNGFMDAFEFSLDPGSEAKKDVQREKETIELEKKEKMQRYEQDKKRLGYFERQDIERTMEREIEIESVAKRLSNCWDVANKRGLFDD
jgi:hypothetical protein